MILAVALGPLLWPVPINDIDFAAQLHGPSWTHPLGTDDLGQDLLARMLYGGRISLSVGWRRCWWRSSSAPSSAPSPASSRGSVDMPR